MVLLEMKWTYLDYTESLDMLARVTRRLSGQYSHTMTRPEAQAHFDARALVLRHRLMTCDEAEVVFHGK